MPAPAQKRKAVCRQRGNLCGSQNGERGPRCAEFPGSGLQITRGMSLLSGLGRMGTGMQCDRYTEMGCQMGQRRKEEVGWHSQDGHKGKMKPLNSTE